MKLRTILYTVNLLFVIKIACSSAVPRPQDYNVASSKLRYARSDEAAVEVKRRIKREGFMDGFNGIPSMMRTLASRIGKGITSMFSVGSNLSHRMIGYMKTRQPKIIYGPWIPVGTYKDPPTAYEQTSNELVSSHHENVDNGSVINYAKPKEIQKFIPSQEFVPVHQQADGDYGSPIGNPFHSEVRTQRTSEDTEITFTDSAETTTHSHSTSTLAELSTHHEKSTRTPKHFAIDSLLINKVLHKTLFYQDLHKYQDKISDEKKSTKHLKVKDNKFHKHDVLDISHSRY